jgi:hypothetical protein
MPGRIRSNPARRDRTLVVGDADGNVWRFDIDTGRVLAQRKFDGAVIVPPVPISESETLVGAGTDLILYGDAGERRAVLSGQPTAPFALAGDRVYAATADNCLSAFQSADLSFVWKIKLPGTCTAVTGKKDAIYLACDSQILALDADANTVWRFQGSARIWNVALLDDEHLVASGEDRRLYFFATAQDR